MEKYIKHYRMVYENCRKKEPQIHTVRCERLLTINKGNTTYQSNKLCRKTCKHNKRRQNNYKNTEGNLFYTTLVNLGWKKSRLFYVTMGAYDEAEVFELVGTFLLYELSLKYNKNNTGLYRDDGVAIFKNISGPKSEV